MPENLFETVCAMLNREGGDILLGVADDGTVVGVDPLRVEALITNIINHSNNPQRLDTINTRLITYKQRSKHYIGNLELLPYPTG